MGRPRATAHFCECGLERPRGQEGCDTCRAIDRQRALRVAPQAYDLCQGPQYMHIADFQQSHQARPHYRTGMTNHGGDVGTDLAKIVETYR